MNFLFFFFLKEKEMTKLNGYNLTLLINLRKEKFDEDKLT